MRLTTPRAELLDFMEQQRERGRALHSAADEVADAETYRDWTHEVERWDALTRDGLRAAYSSDEPAEEFHRATIGPLTSVVIQSEGQELDLRKQGVDGGVHTLTSLEERLRFVQDPADAERPSGLDLDSARDPRRVMVVHGRNGAATRAMFSFLSSMGLQPIDWETAVGMSGEGSPHNLVAVRAAMSNAQAVVVLFTPDDLAHLRPELAHPDDGPDETDPRGQPRPNVLIEAGMALMGDPQHTILVEIGSIRGASDLAGLNAVRLTNAGSDRGALRSRLQNADCRLDEDHRWLEVGSAGDFDAAVPSEPASQGVAASEAGRVPALPSDASPELQERYRTLQTRIDRFLDAYTGIDQPVTDEMLRNFMGDTALDIAWAQGALHELEAAGRLRRNPDGEGYYPVD